MEKNSSALYTTLCADDPRFDGGFFEELAKVLKCAGRHLRSVFEEEYRVSPVQYLQTCRLLLAKNLLTDTNLQIMDLALASGFKSLRRFNAAFREKYHLSASDLRKRISKEKWECKDIGIKHALPGRSPKELRALSEQWRPWRSYATISLWNSLEQREV